jgi:hypothetical protein
VRPSSGKRHQDMPRSARTCPPKPIKRSKPATLILPA